MGISSCHTPAFYDRDLLELHKAHPGITRMKALARMFVWWPRINNQVKKSKGMLLSSHVYQLLHFIHGNG